MPFTNNKNCLLDYIKTSIVEKDSFTILKEIKFILQNGQALKNNLRNNTLCEAYKKFKLKAT